jgi:hypothetical protein
VAGKGDLLSPKLDPDVRQRAARAIKQRGGRVTIGKPELQRLYSPLLLFCEQVALSLLLGTC